MYQSAFPRECPMHLTRTCSSLILAGLVASSPAGPLSAQQEAKPLPALRGAVQDFSGAALEGAEVELLGLARKAITGESGAYHLAGIEPGRYWVVVRRIGYEPLRVALTFEPGWDREIVFQLDARPQRLADIEVTSEDLAWQRKYLEFEWRARTGWGRFLTRDDIEQARPTYLSDVVQRYLPGVSFRGFDRAPFVTDFFSADWGRNGAIGWSYVSRGVTECSPAVSVNGTTPFGGWAVNDFEPGDVEAIEVYRRSRDIPLELQRASGGGCGLVVIWLK